jgi:hypothetical protein
VAGPQASWAQNTGRGPTSHLLDRGVIPILDRSRSRLRIPREILPEALRQASRQGLASPLAAVRLETGGVLVDGRLDPVVAAMLNVIADASLMLTADVQYEGDSSVTTIWATPHRAVMTSALDPELVDIHPVRLPRLPETLTDVIMLRPPEAVGGQTISVPVAELAEAEAEAARGRGEDAQAVLHGAGLSEAEAELALVFQAPATRRWRISSTWAAEDGPQMAQLRGLDAGAQGQWLMEMTGEPSQPGQPGVMSFSPQNDGDILRALRVVLPRRWVGTALNPRPPR